MKASMHTRLLALGTISVLLTSCTTKSRIDDVVKGFFGEVNKSNFETAKSKYLSSALIDEMRALPLVGRQHPTIQETFRTVAGRIDSVALSGELVKGEEATVSVSLTTSWGGKWSSNVGLVKEGGKSWKIRNLGEFKVLGWDHVVTASKQCSSRTISAATAEFQAAIAENPQDSLIVNAMGLCYFISGKADEAAAQYKKAIQLHPNGVWDPYINLAGIYASRGDVSEAEDQLNKAIRNRPDNARGYRELAWLYADKGIKLDRAVEVAEKAVQLAPDDASMLYTLGWAYYRKGMRAEAIRYLSQAVSKAPGSAVIKRHYDEASTTAAAHIARAHQFMNAGRFDQAVEECDAALRQEPENETAKSMRSSIGQEAATRYVVAARTSFEKQQYGPAMSECDKALKYDPKNADAASLKEKIAEVRKVLGYQ